jgi:hypothetical protein
MLPSIVHWQWRASSDKGLAPEWPPEQAHEMMRSAWPRLRICCASVNIESQICSEALIVTERSITSHGRAIIFEKIPIDGHRPILRLVVWPSRSQVLSLGPLAVEIEIGKKGKEGIWTDFLFEN